MLGRRLLLLRHTHGMFPPLGFLHGVFFYLLEFLSARKACGRAQLRQLLLEPRDRCLVRVANLLVLLAAKFHRDFHLGAMDCGRAGGFFPFPIRRMFDAFLEPLFNSTIAVVADSLLHNLLFRNHPTVGGGGAAGAKLRHR